MKRIKLENDGVLTFEQNAELELKICTLYKDGSCQVLGKNELDSLISIDDGNISFVGRTCDDCVGMLCGWYPIRRV